MDNKIEKEKYYTVKDTAKFLEVTEQTVSKYVRNGNLKGEKKGPKQRWYILGGEIIRKRKEWGYN